MGLKRIKAKLFDGAHRKECFYCRTALPFDKATVDHVIPKSGGGSTSIANSVVACKKCNSKKGRKDFDEYVKSCRWRLRQKGITGAFK